VTRRATVLAYHAIGRCARTEDRYNLFVSRDAFADQMRFLARRRRVVTLDDAIERRVPAGPPAVAITFDDAYRNVLENAVPILREHGFPATIFVPTGWTGQPPGWLQASCDLVVMDGDELRRARELGTSLQSHGDGHEHMPSLSDDAARIDVATSTERLERLTGERPRYFAYPFGDLSPRLSDMVRDAGYSAAFAIDRPGTDPFAYERTQITPLDGRAMFRMKTTGRYLAIRQAPATRAAYGMVKPLVARVRR